MKRPIGLLLVASLLGSILAPAAHAGVNVERTGSENPMVEVSRSVIYGGLAGLVVGAAFATAADTDHKGDIVRWCFAGGTAVGLAVGFLYVTHRPQPQAMLEWNGGVPALHAPLPAAGPSGSLLVPMVGVRF